MFRTTSMAALALACLSSAAFAQGAPDPANRPPAQLSGGAQSNDRGYDDRNSYDDRDAPPPAAQDRDQDQYDARDNDQARDSSRDIYCRRSAAASTGYVTPDQAAHDEQTAGSINGAIGGAALGAIIGGASHAAGPGALIGAGAGLIAGTAIGSSNAHRAAADVQAAYSDAYYACMADRNGRPPDARYAYGPPPPPAYYAPYPYPYPYYGPGYYGPSIRLGFGFGGGFGRGGWHGGRHR